MGFKISPSAVQFRALHFLSSDCFARLELGCNGNGVLVIVVTDPQFRVFSFGIGMQLQWRAGDCGDGSSF